MCAYASINLCSGLSAEERSYCGRLRVRNGAGLSRLAHCMAVRCDGVMLVPVQRLDLSVGCIIRACYVS